MNPYKQLDERYFWAPAVGRRSMFDIRELWDPKFRIAKHHRVVTFGSCFAQHIGKALKERGFNWHLVEKSPPEMSLENAKKYNYGIFSARTGNIYTASQLLQWLGWADGSQSVPDEVWKSGERYFDPFRPNIEPDGFSSEEEMAQSRLMAVEAFRQAVVSCSVFVFTLGLAESWRDREYGCEYPMCPGTVAGEFSKHRHVFENHDFPSIRRALTDAVRKIRSLNPSARVLLTVSPVPLTATMSGNHVLVATMESKSILRAVAGQLSRQFRFVDYFPSYEIINAPAFRGSFFEPNQRSVNPFGVAFVMNSFFDCMLEKFPVEESSVASVNRARSADLATDDAICEEELLGAFSPRGGN